MSNRKRYLIIVGVVAIAFVIAGFNRYRFDSGLVLGETVAPTEEKLWEYQCIDTMKFSRDAAREFLNNPAKADAFIPAEVAKVKSLGANCIALGTPYDEEFIPILKKWVSAARAENLSVWYRGNMSAWENWFDYPRYTDPKQHHAGIYQFILRHPELFEGRDILTPAPEAENGIMGNPWRTSEAREQLRQFIIASADNCRAAMKAIGKDIRCGFFSANGDVAEQIYDADSTSKTGGAIVMDHYISSIDRMSRDIERVALKHNAPVMLGEFGAPIPDINGVMTESQQENFVRGLLDVFYKQADKVMGINYWVLRGGSTTVLNDDGSERAVTDAIRDYYKPGVYAGTVRNTIGQPLSGAIVKTQDASVVTDRDGKFKIIAPAGAKKFAIEHADHKSQSILVALSQGNVITRDILLEPNEQNLWYKAQLRAFRAFGKN